MLTSPRSLRIVPHLICLIGMASGLLGSIKHAQAAELIDSRQATLLQEGQAQRVIVQYLDTAGPQGETESQRRQRRQSLKDKVFTDIRADHLRSRRDYSELPMSSMVLTQSSTLQQLLRNPNVAYVFPDKRLKAHLTQALPLIGQPPVATTLNRQGTGKSMAIIDTGVDYTRAEFGNCTSPGVPSGSCKVVAAYEAAPDDGALDSIGHGTEVAMTALATAPQARIVAIDVFDGQGAYTSDILNGINWVISNRSTYNITVINMSLGDGVQHTAVCGNTDPFYSGIRNARNAGLVVVAASGNEGYASGISSPACVAQAVAVGAVYDASQGGFGWQLNRVDEATGTVTTSTCQDTASAADQITCFSNSSSLLDVLAPGAMITVGGQTVAGTSLAAPFVTGAVAVLRAQFPSETPSQIETRITSSGKALLDTRNGLSKPRLDLLAAQGAPANDALASATALSGNSGSASGWNYNATAQASEPAHAGQTASHSVWWSWTAPANGTLSLNTEGSGCDTVLALYTGTTITALNAVASDDDGGNTGGSSALLAPVSSGQTYRIAIDGKAAQVGATQLNWSFSTTPYQADVSISLSSGGGAIGQAFGLDMSASNAGPQAASMVNALMTLPSGISFDSIPNGCTKSGQTATCTLASMASGSNANWHFTVMAASTGTYAVSASINSSMPDPNSSNNTSALNVVVTTSTTTGGSDSGDVPLPPWALLSLGAGLWGVVRRQTGRHEANASGPTDPHPPAI